MEKHLNAHENEKSAPDRKASVLSERDIRALTLMCIDILSFSSRLVGKSNPTVSAVLAYVRDEVAANCKVDPKRQHWTGAIWPIDIK
jgi:hypothetical protein